MATLVSVTPTGFNVTGLTRPWRECDLGPLARRIGALSVAWGDVTQQSLAVVCDADPAARDAAIMQLVRILRDQELYGRRQRVEIINIDIALVLVRFGSGLPDQDVFGPDQPSVPAIGQVVYGSNNVVLVRANGVSDDDWDVGISLIWDRLVAAGIPSNRFESPPFHSLPWTRSDETGMIVMVDPGLAIIESCQPIPADFDAAGYRYENMPVVVAGSHNIVLAAGESWPEEERTVLTSASIRFHIEVGRTSDMLASRGFLDYDAPITTL